MLENNQKELILLKDLGIKFPVNTFTKKRRFGLFKCFCGVEFETQISNIKNGHTKSCGCYKSKLISEKNRITKKIHGFKSHRLYGTWYMMIHRCNNQKNISYDKYGGRGITVCDRWKNFNNFIEDMFPTFQEGLTLDRKNNDLGYSVDNCRWANQNIQTRNIRLLKSNNTSGYKGVCFHKASSKWISQIGVNKKQIHLGSFDTAIEGAKAYDKYVITNNLEHTLNFK